MNTDRLFRIFDRMMETNGSLVIGSFVAIVGLILLVVISRKIRNRKAKPKAADIMMSAPDMGADDDVALDMADDDAVTFDISDAFDQDTHDIDFDDAAIIADMQADNPLTVDELDADIDHRFDDDSTELDDLDDITIPKIGEAPPPKQSRFFSASWLGRKNKSDAPPISLDMTPSNVEMGDLKASDAAHKSAAECARLGEIERRMMALRELYEAGLIAPEVYVVKAREFAAQV